MILLVIPDYVIIAQMLFVSLTLVLSVYILGRLNALNINAIDKSTSDGNKKEVAESPDVALNDEIKSINESSIPPLIEGLKKKLQEDFYGATMGQTGSFLIVEKKINELISLVENVARTSSNNNKLIGSRGIFISKETIDTFISATLYPEVYTNVKTLFYWQDYFIKISSSYENELYLKVQNIISNEKYYIKPVSAILVAPFSKGNKEQSISNIEENLNIYKYDETKAASGLIIKPADYTHKFINVPEFSKTINGFLSKELSGIMTSIKLIETGRKEILTIWNVIQDLTLFINKELEPLLYEKNISNDNSNFKSKVTELEILTNRLEYLVLLFAKQKLITTYNSIRSLKLNYIEKVKSKFPENEEKLLEWGNIYNEILELLKEYMEEKIDIIISPTIKGDSFNDDKHTSDEPAIETDKVGPGEIVEVIEERFVFNGKEKVKMDILKAKVIYSKY